MFAQVVVQRLGLFLIKIKMESYISSYVSSSLSDNGSSSSSSLIDPYAEYRELAAELYRTTGMEIGNFEDEDEYKVKTCKNST